MIVVVIVVVVIVVTVVVVVVIVVAVVVVVVVAVVVVAAAAAAAVVVLVLVVLHTVVVVVVAWFLTPPVWKCREVQSGLSHQRDLVRTCRCKGALVLGTFPGCKSPGRELLLKRGLPPPPVEIIYFN